MSYLELFGFIFLMISAAALCLGLVWLIIDYFDNREILKELRSAVEHLENKNITNTDRIEYQGRRIAWIEKRGLKK